MTKYLMLEYPAMYDRVKRYRRIKDIPKGNDFAPKAVSFGLWGVWYVTFRPEGMIGTDGEPIPFHIAHLIGVGAVIGRRDIEAAKGKPYAEAWRQSVIDSINERLRLPANTYKELLAQ